MGALLPLLVTLTDAAHKAAQKAYLDAFGTELALRQEHFVAIDRLAGEVRAVFPGDKARQDLIFAVMDDAEADTGDDAATATPAAPAPGTSTSTTP